MGKLKDRLREKIALATGHVAAKEGANGYVGDNPHEAQANNASSGTNTGSSIQMKKKKATSTTGSGVNIV